MLNVTTGGDLLEILLLFLQAWRPNSAVGLKVKGFKLLDTGYMETD